LINKKIKIAVKIGLKVIFCLGETFDERNKGLTQKVIGEQLIHGISSLKSLDNVNIAYEPVWAIGTGQNATPNQAQEAHKYLRDILATHINNKVAENTRILYGGSVTPENTRSLVEMPDIDGCLIGGSSLDAKKFAAIIKT
jgi:triosephosphate isomerase